MGFFQNKTVTLFNRYFDAVTEEEIWYPTLFDHADLVENRKTVVSQKEKEKTDTVMLYIDEENLPKQYLETKAWAALPLEERGKYFTLTLAEDFFVKGDCTGIEIPEKDFYEWIRKRKDGVYKVIDINRYEDILPHFEIGGS